MRSRNTRRRNARRVERSSLQRWMGWRHGWSWKLGSSRSIRRRVGGVGRIRWAPCCGSRCVQLLNNLSDPSMEDLLYESESVRRFVGLRPLDAMADETTILNFRHLPEGHGLGEALFEEINAHQAARGHRPSRGKIMDASIIDAPSSTKNEAGERDEELHQKNKGEPVVLRHQGAHRGGRRVGPDAWPGDDGGERVRRGDGALGAARQGEDGVGRLGLSGRGQATGEQGPGRGLGDGDAAGAAPATRQIGPRRRPRRSARRRCGRRWDIRSSM